MSESESDGAVADPQQEIRELRDRVEALEEELKRRPSKAEVNIVFRALTGGTFQDVTVDPVEHLDVAEDFNSRVNAVEQMAKRHESIIQEQDTVSGNPREQAWQDIVEAANNLSGADHELSNNRVVLFVDNIAQATGRSDQRASDYIEEFGEAKEGADWKPYRRQSKGASARRKRLIVDLDVWGEDDD